MTDLPKGPDPPPEEPDEQQPPRPPPASEEADALAAKVADDLEKTLVGLRTPDDFGLYERGIRLRAQRAERQRFEAITEVVKEEGANSSKQVDAEIGDARLRVKAEIEDRRRRTQTDLKLEERRVEAEVKRAEAEVEREAEKLAASIEREGKLTDVEVRERDSERIGKQRERVFLMAFTAFGAVLTTLTILGVAPHEPVFYLGTGAGVAASGSGLYWLRALTMNAVE